MTLNGTTMNPDQFSQVFILPPQLLPAHLLPVQLLPDQMLPVLLLLQLGPQLSSGGQAFIISVSTALPGSPGTLQGKFRLCIPFLGIARPQSQFPHSCV
jgi:hypothetical protein